MEVEVKVEACGTMFHLHVDRLRFRKPYFLVAAGHQFGHHRQLVGKEIRRLQSLGVEVKDVPLACTRGYQLLVVFSDDAEVTVDAE